MAYEILISPAARNDLFEIYQYIAEDLNAVQSAIGQLERLERAIYSLDELPERYPRYDREPWFSRNLRIMPVDNYVVFYLPNKDGQEVAVLRVIYGGRDLQKQLGEEESAFKYT